MIEKQNINIPMITTIGIISTVMLFVIFIGLQAWFYSELQDEHAIKNKGAIDWKLTDHEMTQQEKLSTYRMVDAEKQIVSVPIDQAIKLTAKRYESNQ